MQYMLYKKMMGNPVENPFPMFPVDTVGLQTLRTNPAAFHSVAVNQTTLRSSQVLSVPINNRERSVATETASFQVLSYRSCLVKGSSCHIPHINEACYSIPYCLTKLWVITFSSSQCFHKNHL